MAAKPKTLIVLISERITARRNCIDRDNPEWRDKHEDALDLLARELPRGSGIDHGTKIDLDRSTGDRIVLSFGFHFMDQNGYYCGWGEYSAVIRPAFHGIDVTIKGRNRNDIKDYLYQTYEYALTREYIEEYDADKGSTFTRHTVEA